MPLLAQLLAPAALLLALLSTACAPSVVLAPRPPIPDALLACKPQPEPPAGDDADLANFILDLADAGQDCRARLGALKGVLTP